MENQCQKQNKENEKTTLNNEAIESLKSIASMEEKILALLRLKFPLKQKSAIHLGTVFIHDLEMDSLDLAELVMEIEILLNVKSFDYEPQNILKVSDLIKHVKTKIANLNRKNFKKIGIVLILLGSFFALGTLGISKDAELAEKVGAFLPSTVCWTLGLFYYCKGKFF